MKIAGKNHDCRFARVCPSKSIPEIDVAENFSEFASSSGSSASGRAWGRFESSSSKLHRAKCGNGKQVADDVGSLDASKCGGRKSRLEQIAHLLRGSGGGTARIELFDRFNCGEALRGRVFHRIEILIGEQREQNADECGSNRSWLFAQR